MAITYVSNQEDYTGSGATSPRTVSVDIGTRTNGLLVVAVSYRAAAQITFTATYGGVSMTMDVDYHSATPQHGIVTFSLGDPADGANDFALSWASGAPANLYILASWYDGAAQTSWSDNTATDTGATDPSIAITPSQAGCVIVSNYMSESDTVLTVGDGETEINNIDEGTRVAGGSYVIQTTAVEQTVDWAGTDNVWTMGVSAYRAVASGAINITPAEATQAQASDAVTIRAISPIVPAEATQAQLSDAASITAEGPTYPITAGEATQAQASDAASIVATTPIAPAEATQAQASDAASLTAIYLLTPGEATQIQTSDAATLGQFTPIAPAESTQAQTSDIATLTAIYPVTPAEATQAQASDAVTLTAIYPIAPTEATQSQTSDAAVITGAGTYAIAPAEATQEQASDSATITAVYPVTVTEATQTQISDAVGISFTPAGGETSITPAEATQAQTSDAATFSAIVYVITVADATQAQSSDLAVLTSPVTAYPPGNRRLLEPQDRLTGEMAVRANSVFATRANMEVDD